MNRNRSATRVLSLLRLLEQRRRWRLRELSEKFNVTTRTVRRDLDVLQEAGYPICHANADMPAGEWWLR